MKPRIIAAVALTGALVLGILVCSTPQTQPATAQGVLTPGGRGDILGVTAGSGLTGGATSGTATLNVGVGSGLSVSADAVTIDSTYTQRRITGTCTSGTEAVIAVGETGGVTCGSVGTAYTAGDGLTLTANDFDVVAATGGGLTVGASDIGIKTSCSSDQVLRWDGDSWECTAVNTGSTVSCAAGTAVTLVNAAGSPSCGSVAATDGDKTDITVSSSGTVWNIDSAAVGVAELADDLDLSTNASTTVGDFRGATITTSDIGSTTQNDFSPTGLSTATYVRVTCTGGSAVITGLAGGSAGRLIILTVVGSTAITLTNQAAGSSPANRFLIGGSIILNVNDSIALIYDGTLGFWRQYGLSSGDVSSVVAGTGLANGGTSGDVTLNVGCGTGITCNANDVTLALSTQDCSAGSFFDSNTATGTFNCVAEVGDISEVSYPSGGGMTSSGSTTSSGSAEVALRDDCEDYEVLRRSAPEGGPDEWVCSVDVRAISNSDGDITIAESPPGTNAYTVELAADIEVTSITAADVTTTDDLVVGDDSNLTAGTTTVGDFRGTTIAPSLTASQNDWAPTGYLTATIIDMAATGNRDITGLQGGASGREVTLYNNSAFIVKLYSGNGASTAGNRFVFSGADIQHLSQYSGIVLRYDGTISRWVGVANSSYAKERLYAFTTLGADGNATLNANVTLGDADADVTTIRMVKDSSTAPTLSTCGTSPTVTGGSNAFRITVGTSGGTACTATFASTKTATPTCIARIEDVAEEVYISALSATAITVTAKTGTTDISSNVIDVICIGDA